MERMVLVDPDDGTLFLSPSFILRGGMTLDQLGELKDFRSSSTMASDLIRGELLESPHGPVLIGMWMRQGHLDAVDLQFTGATGRAVRKELHDSLLVSSLGIQRKQRRVARTFLDRLLLPVKKEAWLLTAQELRWEFSWGQAFSTVDPREGDPTVWVRWKRSRDRQRTRSSQ